MTDDPDKHNHKMDKKSSFPSSFAANTNKTLTLDSSLKAAAFTRQDGASGSQVSKVQHKAPSRYKGASGNTNPRNDSNRSKPSFSRGRGNVDKRGKPRGSSTTSESVANRKDEPAEAGSIQFPGGKKQNFDDLWGFHFAPREGRNYGFSQGFGHGRSHPPGGGQLRCYGGPNRAKFAKDYLLANCQFLVRMGEDYTVYLADPNLLVNWELIEHVRIRIDGETPKCPICLDFPVAAKITKCGHIYCWSCFLHYLALSDNKVRTCPICYEPVSRKDLKSVSLLSQEGIQVGSKIEMQLMVRAKDSFVANPVEKYSGWESKFCKILQVAPEKIIQTVLFQEQSELDSMFASDSDAPEVCFIQEALQELMNRQLSLTGMQHELNKDIQLPSSGLLPPDVVFSTALNEKQEVLAFHMKTEIKAKTRNDSVSSNSSCGYDDSSTSQHQMDGPGDCYFYQINDGRNVFLHPLNMAMLWRELGNDPEKWPQILTFEVIDVESKSATEEVRKRMKFIRHLPKNAPFDLVEVSMKEWGISPDVYGDFASQIGQREQRRKNRAKEEKNIERKLREREAAEFSKFRHLPQISSPQEFPAFGINVLEPEMGLSEFPDELMVEGAMENPSVLPSCEPSSCLDSFPTQSLSSFAQIAGKAPLKKSPTFPLPKQGAWASVIAPTAAIPVHHRHSDSENDGEDYMPVPNYRASVSDAIERAMAGLDLKKSEEAAAGAQPSPSSAGNKKKKGKKGKVLFATGMGAFQ